MTIYTAGSMIADRYEVRQTPDVKRGIRVGGMGLIYLCHDTQTDRPVALKFFKPEYLPDRAAQARFLREGGTWKQLGHHPHIVRCYDVKYIDPTAFLSLELIANEQNPNDPSLCAWIGAPMPVGQALLFALQIARGMQYAAGKIPGFVHRDLKPANVLVGADKLPGTDVNRLLVTDFGLIKILAEVSVDVEGVHPVSSQYKQPLFTRLAGTYEYMAPEQWKGEPVGIYTDVYALGCILYEMISGQSAVEGATAEELQAAHCNGRLRPVPQDLLQPISAFLGHSLAVDSKQRYQTWEQVTQALESLYDELGYGPVPRPARPADEDLEERRSRGSSTNAMGISYAQIGRAREAIGYFEKGVSIYHELGDRQQEGALLGNLGNAYAQLGKVDKALRYCEQDLEIAREVGDQRREAMALGNLGDICRGRGEIQRAIQYYEQRLQITRQIQDRRSEGNALGGLGQSYAALGNVELALTYYKEQLLITREIRDRRGEGHALCNFGNACLAIGNFDEALAYYHQYLEIVRDIGDRTGEGVALGSLGNVQLSRGRLMSAMEFYQQRIEIAQQTGDRRGEGNALGNMGIAYTQLGQLDEALRCNQQRLEVAAEIDDQIGLCTTLFNMGHLYMQMGKSQDAMQAWVKSYILAREMNLSQGLQKLAGLGPKLGLPEGLEIWERLAQVGMGEEHAYRSRC